MLAHRGAGGVERLPGTRSSPGRGRCCRRAHRRLRADVLERSAAGRALRGLLLGCGAWRPRGPHHTSRRSPAWRPWPAATPRRSSRPGGRAHDSLTGLLNHGAMQVRTAEEICPPRRGGNALTCLMVDLDNFKPLNDRPGTWWETRSCSASPRRWTPSSGPTTAGPIRRGRVRGDARPTPTRTAACARPPPERVRGPDRRRSETWAARDRLRGHRAVGRAADGG